MPIPRPCRALTMPFFSRPRHRTAIERRPVGYLPAFGFFRLPRGVPRRLLSEAYQSSSQRSIRTAVKSGSSKLEERRSVKLLDQQFGYFRLPRGLSRRTRHCRSRAGARHGMCELTKGMGTACYVWIGRNACEETGVTSLVSHVSVTDDWRHCSGRKWKKSVVEVHLWWSTSPVYFMCSHFAWWCTDVCKKESPPVPFRLSVRSSPFCMIELCWNLLFKSPY